MASNINVKSKSANSTTQRFNQNQNGKVNSNINGKQGIPFVVQLPDQKKVLVYLNISKSGKGAILSFYDGNDGTIKVQLPLRMLISEQNIMNVYADVADVKRGELINYIDLMNSKNTS